MSELRLIKAGGKVVSVFSGPEIQTRHVAADLENMMRALARHHGEPAAQDIMAEAFAQTWARWAEPQGPICARFALEVALDNAQRRAGREATQTPDFFPGGGSAA